MGRAAVGLALLALLSSCKNRDSSAEPSATPSPAPPPKSSEISLSSPQAYDLVALPDGAAVFFGKPRGGLAFAKLDASGRRTGDPLSITNKNAVVEIAAASDETRLGVAWVEKDSTGSASFGVLGDAATRSFAEPSALGKVLLADVSERGELGIGVND